MTILFMAVVGLITLAVQMKTFIKKNKALKQELANMQYQSQTDNKMRIVIYLSLMVFSLVSVVAGIYLNDQVSIALGVILFFIGAGELMSYNVKNKIYYNNERFIIDGVVTRYRSIKRIHTKKKIGITLYEVHCLNGEVVPISKKSIDIIRANSKFKF